MLLDVLTIIPKPLQLSIAGLILGGAGFWGLEARYVSSSEFTKNYILSLKREIRETRKELNSESLSDRERELLEEDLAELIDELCYETNNRDRLCEGVD